MLSIQVRYYPRGSWTQAACHSLLENDAIALSNQGEVTEAMHNYRTLVLFDNIWEDCECRRETRITLGEIFMGAHHPVNVGRCVNCRLDISTIEVRRRGLSHEE